MPATALKVGEPWQEEEDRLLTHYQAIYGNKWSKIAAHIQGRNGQACAQRWRHKVNPNILRDKWTTEEDETLIRLVEEIGHHWAAIARHLPGRTDQQCMGRWRRHLDPNISKDAWTPEEDAQLLALHEQHGPSWSCIAKCLTNRTPQQCRGRWCIMVRCRQMQQQGAPSNPPQTPHAPTAARSRGRCSAAAAAGSGAAGTLAAAAARRVSAVSISRRATTEVPAMPASAAGDEAQQATVQTRRRAARRTGDSVAAGAGDPAAPAQPAGVHLTVRKGSSPEAEEPTGLQAQQSAEDRDSSDEGEQQSTEQSEGDSGQLPQDHPEGISRPYPNGRLHLGRRVVYFRTRPRTTRSRPRARTSSLLVGCATPLPARRCRSQPHSQGTVPVPVPVPSQVQLQDAAGAPRPHAETLVAAIELLSPPRAGIILEDDDEAAMLSGLLDEEDEDGSPLRSGGGGAAVEAVVQQGLVQCMAARHGVEQEAQDGAQPAAKQAARPSCSYSPATSLDGEGGEAGCAGGESAAPGACAVECDDADESGTCSSSEEAGPGLQRGRSTRRHACGLAQGDATAEVTTRRTRSGRSCPASYSTKTRCHSRTSQATSRATSTTSGQSGGAAGRSTAQQRPRPVSTTHAAGQGPNPEAQREAGPSTAGAAAMGPVNQAGGPRSGSRRSSLVLSPGFLQPGALEGPGEALPAWHDVGSPPTSSMLAKWQAGLLSTPTGQAREHSPNILNAPVPPGMPKPSPGVTNEWSDVPAVSWSEWRECHGNFGILTRQQFMQGGPAGLQQLQGFGTPDNTRPAVRAPDGLRGAGVTPRRDMFVRPAPVPAGLPRNTLLQLETSGGNPNGEGHGGTHPLVGSPMGSAFRSRTRSCRRASADEAILERHAQSTAAAAASSGGGPAALRTMSAQWDAGSPQPGQLGALVEPGQPLLPDYCSPSKKPRMGGAAAAAAIGIPGAAAPASAASLPLLPGLPLLRPAHVRGGSLGAFPSLSVRPTGGLLDNLPSNLWSSTSAPGPSAGPGLDLSSSLLARLQQLGPLPTAAVPALVTPDNMQLDDDAQDGAEGPDTAGSASAVPAPAAAPPLGGMSHHPMPPALARALMPPPTMRARQLGRGPMPPLPPLVPSLLSGGGGVGSSSAAADPRVATAWEGLAVPIARAAGEVAAGAGPPAAAFGLQEGQQQRMTTVFPILGMRAPVVAALTEGRSK